PVGAHSGQAAHELEEAGAVEAAVVQVGECGRGVLVEEVAIQGDGVAAQDSAPGREVPGEVVAYLPVGLLQLEGVAGGDVIKQAAAGVHVHHKGQHVRLEGDRKSTRLNSSH